MNTEYEVRVLNIDREEVIKKLKEVKSYEGNQARLPYEIQIK